MQAQGFGHPRRQRVCAENASGRPRDRQIAPSRFAAGQDNLQHLWSGIEQFLRGGMNHAFIGQCQTKATCAALQPPPMRRPPGQITTAGSQGFEQAIAIHQATILRRQGFNAVVAAENNRAHSTAPIARSRPLALARVSCSSWSGLESATMPPPARNCSLSPCNHRLRIRMFRSMSPLPST